jgi:hypothetical protein
MDCKFNCIRCGYNISSKGLLMRHLVSSNPCKAIYSDKSLHEIYETIFQRKIKDYYEERLNKIVDVHLDNCEEVFKVFKCVSCENVFNTREECKHHTIKYCERAPLKNRINEEEPSYELRHYNYITIGQVFQQKDILNLNNEFKEDFKTMMIELLNNEGFCDINIDKSNITFLYYFIKKFTLLIFNKFGKAGLLNSAILKIYDYVQAYHKSGCIFPEYNVTDYKIKKYADKHNITLDEASLKKHEEEEMFAQYFMNIFNKIVYYLKLKAEIKTHFDDYIQLQNNHIKKFNDFKMSVFS